jgi:hypothetical protein
MTMRFPQQVKPIGQLPPRRKETSNDIKKAINSIFNGTDPEEVIENTIERMKL